MEFASAVQALRCAISIQTTLNAQADGVRLRIGVHQGEVVPEGDDLLGDGVIVAARLEPLAEPGGICISSRVREDASGKMALEVEDLGEPALKNIAAKVRAFRLRPGAPAERPVLALPDKPSLAVLPFQNMSGDPEQEYFTDGMVEDITTAIARLPWLFVIARNSSFTYKGKAVDIKQVGRELGVRYVLEGSVRKAGNHARITGQLIDTTTGAHIWADRIDGSLEDVFALQDQVAGSGRRARSSRDLRQSEIGAGGRASRPDSLDAYDLYLRAPGGAPQVRGSRRCDAGQPVAPSQRALAIRPLLRPGRCADLALAATSRDDHGHRAASRLTDAERRRRALRLARDVQRRLRGRDDPNRALARSGGAALSQPAPASTPAALERGRPRHRSSTSNCSSWRGTARGFVLVCYMNLAGRGH